MKKLISYLITAMMVFTMIPGIAFAGSETNEELNVSYTWVNPVYEDIISEADLQLDSEPAAMFAAETTYATTPEEAAAVVREYMVNRVDSYTLYYKIPAADVEQGGEYWFSDLCDQIFPKALEHTGNPCEGDFIRYTYGGYNIPSTSISGDGTYYYLPLPVQMIYYTTYDQEEQLTEEVNAVLSKIITDGMTDYEKIKAIYDYMTANISYDYEHYGDDSYKLQFTAYAAMVNKTSVCQGYANLFYRLALECGIDNRIISGTSINNQGNPEGHAWNIVKLGNKYYNVDATWDSTWDSDKTTHDFFLQGTTTFENHTRDAEYTADAFNNAYPMSDTDYVPGTDDEQGGSEGTEPEVPTEPEQPVECTHATTEIIPAVAATCTTTGLTEGLKCASCGEILTAQNVEPAIGHDLTEHVAKDPTCTLEGNIEYYTCDVCGKLYADAEGKKEITKPDTIIGAEAHIFQEVTVAPTCTEPGQKKLVCIGCGKTIVTSTTLPTGHTPDGNPIIEPTCEKDGLIVTVKCAVCGETIKEQEVIPALGHDLIKHVAKDPTCTLEGNIEYYTCSKCGKLYADAEGKKEITKPDTIIGAEAHIFQEVTVAPTCTEPGQKKLVCIGCGKTIVTSTTLPTGHTPDGNPIIEPTCEKDGLIVTVKCAVCGEIIKEQEVIPALGHTPVIIPAKPGNCSNGGSTEGLKCSVCNKVLEEPKYSDTPVHTFSKTYKVVTPATMQKEGLKAIVCTKCGAVSEKSIEIPQIKSATVTALVYNGSVRNPVPNIVNYYKNTKLKKGTDYTVVYKNGAGTKVVKPKNVGKYTAVITFKGQYKGTIKRTFNINPKATVINKLTKPAKKQIKVTLQKRTAQVTGYEIQYSTTKNFTKKTTKTLKVKNFKTNTKTIKNLKAKKKYWVKVRTYKNVNGKLYYSAWSKVKYITTK